MESPQDANLLRLKSREEELRDFNNDFLVDIIKMRIKKAVGEKEQKADVTRNAVKNREQLAYKTASICFGVSKQGTGLIPKA